MNEALFNDNSALITLLPPLIEHLYVRDSSINLVIGYINHLITKVSKKNPDFAKQLELIRQQLQKLCGSDEHYSRIKGQKDALAIDTNKSITLSLLFGNLFTDAIEILSDPSNVLFFSKLFEPGNDIAINDDSGDLIFELVQQYLHTGRDLNGRSIMVGVRERTEATTNAHVEQIHKQLMEIEVNEMLYKIGLLYRNSRLIKISDEYDDMEAFFQQQLQDKERLQSDLALKQEMGTHYRRQHYVVDLFNWYCSCSQYQSCYIQDWIHKLPPRIGETISDTSPLFDHIKLDQINPLPICSHILVLLIIKANHSPTNALYTYSSNVHDVINV